MKTHQIHLIRHGLTEANIKGQYIGATDLDLAPTGIERLMELRAKFEYPRADKIFSSPLKRCQQTAQILYPNHDLEVINGLAECNFGEWEGKDVEALKENEDFKKWLNKADDSTPAGGESLHDFATRVLATFDKLVETAIKSNYKDTVIVTHGGVIMTILAAHGAPRAKFYEWAVNNGCGYSLRIMPSLWMRQKVGEVYAKVPYRMDKENNDESAYILNFMMEGSDEN